MSDYDKTEIVNDIKRVASLYQSDTISRSEYLKHGNFSEYQLYDGGYSWAQLCEMANLKCKKNEPVSDEEYFERLVTAVEDLGRYPNTSERKKYGLNMSKSRYPTLMAFIEKAIDLGYVKDLREDQSASNQMQQSIIESSFPLLKQLSVHSKEIKRPTAPIPLNTPRARWERTGLDGYPYAPQDESGVIALFAILCSKGIIPWQIVDLNGGKGIDSVCFDENSHREIRVELKHLLSKAGWNHNIDDIDYVVCWENRWPDFPKPVIELCKYLRET